MKHRTRPGALLAALLTLCAAGCGTQSAAPDPNRITAVTVDKTAFVLRLADGRELRDAALRGATLTLAMTDGVARKVKIDAVHTDPNDTDHEITLYHMLAVEADGSTGELCEPDPQGERWAFPVRGQWDAHGKHISDKGYTLTCASGAQGKCVRFGYKPWKTLADGTDLAPYHQACVRAVIADYCGGKGTTRDGMLIDIYDRHRIQQRDPAGEAAQGVSFEAAWTPDGAVCVAHTRVPENITLEQLARECPRLRGHLGTAACSEERAKRSPDVLIFMGSR